MLVTVRMASGPPQYPRGNGSTSGPRLRSRPGEPACHTSRLRTRAAPLARGAPGQPTRAGTARRHHAAPCELYRTGALAPGPRDGRAPRRVARAVAARAQRTAARRRIRAGLPRVTPRRSSTADGARSARGNPRRAPAVSGAGGRALGRRRDGERRHRCARRGGGACAARAAGEPAAAGRPSRRHGPARGEPCRVGTAHPRERARAGAAPPRRAPGRARRGDRGPAAAARPRAGPHRLRRAATAALRTGRAATDDDADIVRDRARRDARRTAPRGVPARQRRNRADPARARARPTRARRRHRVPSAGARGPRVMTTFTANGVTLGVEHFGDAAAPLVLLAGGTTMLSWPDALCEALAHRGRHVVRYDLRDSGESTTIVPKPLTYTLRDLAADAAALARGLDDRPAHLAGIGVGGMVGQVAALDHPDAFSALTLAGTRPVAPGRVDEDLPDHDAATMERLFSRPMPDWSDRAAVAEFATAGAEILGNDPVAARATTERIWDRTPTTEPAVQMANQLGMVFSKLDCQPRWRERLPELAIPTLVVHGRRDPFFPVGNGEALARDIPDARLLVLERAATAIPAAAASEVAAAMLAL